MVIICRCYLLSKQLASIVKCPFLFYPISFSFKLHLMTQCRRKETRPGLLHTNSRPFSNHTN